MTSNHTLVFGLEDTDNGTLFSELPFYKPYRVKQCKFRFRSGEFATVTLRYTGYVEMWLLGQTEGRESITLYTAIRLGINKNA